MFSSCAKQEFDVVVVSDDREVSLKIAGSLPRNCHVRVSEAAELNGLNDCNLLWIHDVKDSSAFDSAEIVAFVKKGGDLVLSSGAVLQLNNWGLEAEPISEWVYEGGEFAQLPFYSHPLFDDMPFEFQLSHLSGNSLSAYGFVGSGAPQMKKSSVIAVAYEDGACRLDRRTIWESSLIHGEILALGAGFPAEEQWAGRRYLKRMSAAVVSYMLGKKEVSDKSYSGVWGPGALRVADVHAGHHVDCKICAAEYEPVRPHRPEEIDVPKAKKIRMAEAGELIELTAGNMSLKADEVSGISELWIDGVRIVADYRPLVNIEAIDRVIAFSEYTPEIEMQKSGFTRYYDIDGVGLTESVIVCQERSSVVIHYQWNDSRVRQFFTEHKADLAFGYPYDGTVMSLLHVWSLQLNGTVVRSEDKNFCSIVGSNAPGRVTLCGRYDDVSYADWRVTGENTDKLQVASSVVYNVRGLKSMDVVISGTADGVDGLLMDYATTLRTPREILDGAF